MKLFTLRNGNTLSYYEFGDTSSSNVVLYSHGFPGTGQEAGIAHRAAIEQKVRIISPSRPGIGNSSFDANRTIMTWPDLANELLDSLSITSISLLGVSGGTPYALAYLLRYPERVRTCLIVSGMGPPTSVHLDKHMSLFSRIPIWCAYNFPSMAKLLISLIALISIRFPTALLQCYRLCMSLDDKRILARQTNAKNMLENFRLALLQGAQGVYHDFRLLMSDWGFSLDQIARPVTLLHGDDDKLVPVSIAQLNHEQLRNSTLVEVPRRGHFMAFDITSDIVQRLTIP